MMLNFPNSSRSFEAARNRVRFWGYDSSIEITFFVDSGTLQKLSVATTAAEDAVLAAFDSAVPEIHAAAAKAYKRAKHGTYAVAIMDEDFSPA
jgi:hypothetical protein